MTLYEFRRFSLAEQLSYVLDHGTRLLEMPTWRGSYALSLYHLDEEDKGFFVEVGTDDLTGQQRVQYSFQNAKTLALYTQEVRLPLNGY